MPSKKLVVGVAVAVLVLFGVMSATSPPERDDCYTTTGDPTLEYCLIEKEPPDLDLRNHQDETRTLSVLISKNASVVYSENITMEGGEIHVLEDILRTPGEYEIRASLGDGPSDSMTWVVDERNCVNCGRVIRITSGGDVVAEPYPLQ
jgi:hypothetical protein